jgi:urea transport system substrate-binding protein
VNKEWIAKWHAFTKNDKRTFNDPMEATVIGFELWVQAVTKAGTTDPDKVEEAIIGLETPNLAGGIAKMLPNHHLTKPVLIGEVRADGQFDTVWKTEGTVPGDAWTDFLDGSKDVEADWTGAATGGTKCGNYNKATKVCSGQNL